MAEEANSERILSEDRLQDINGGCSNCDSLVQSYNGFNQQGDHLHAMADKIRQANMSAPGTTNGVPASWQHISEQALRDKAITSYRNAGFVKDAITKIGHLSIK